MKTMDMIKITKDMLPEVKETVLTSDNGVSIIVKHNISYAQKEKLAIELMAYINAENEDTHTMYTNYKEDLVEMFLICKYYTNIDISDMNTEDDWKMLYDWLVFECMDEKIMSVISHDYDVVYGMAMTIIRGIQKINDKNYSLFFQLQNLLGSLLEVGDITDALAKSEEVNNTMIDLIGAYNKQKQEEATKPAKKQKLDSGLVVNFAKKKK